MEHRRVVQTANTQDLIRYYNESTQEGKLKLNTYIERSLRLEIRPVARVFRKGASEYLLKADREIVEFVVQNYYDINNKSTDLAQLAERALDEGWNDVFEMCVGKVYTLEEIGNWGTMNFFQGVILRCVILGDYDRAHKLYNEIPSKIGMGYDASSHIASIVRDYAIKESDVQAFLFVEQINKKLLVEDFKTNWSNAQIVEIAVRNFLENRNKEYVFRALKYHTGDEVLLIVKKYDEEMYRRLVETLEENV
jgi:hypothetical protein